MFSVLCHNNIDNTYTVIDWNDIQIDRLSPIEFWECVNQFSFDIKGVDRTQGTARVNTLSLFDSKYKCRELINKWVLLEQTAFCTPGKLNERNLQIMLYDKKTGTLRNLFLSINYDTKKQDLTVGKVCYKTLSADEILLRIEIKVNNEVAVYLYVFDRDFVKVHTSGIISGKSEVSFDNVEKTILVDDKPIYKWR